MGKCMAYITCFCFLFIALLFHGDMHTSEAIDRQGLLHIHVEWSISHRSLGDRYVIIGTLPVDNASHNNASAIPKALLYNI